jgi:hypothetical protein
LTESKFKIQKEKDCGVCKTRIYLIFNTESEKEFWMHTKPEDIPKGEEWKPHFHNPSWCKRKEKLPPRQNQSSRDRELEEQEQTIAKLGTSTENKFVDGPVVKMQKTEQEPEMETADQLLQFDRTFKLVKMKIFKNRKVSKKTIPSLNDFEMRDYYIEMEVECELGADVPRLAREHFAKIENAITQEIQQDILRGIPEDD